MKFVGKLLSLVLKRILLSQKRKLNPSYPPSYQCNDQQGIQRRRYEDDILKYEDHISKYEDHIRKYEDDLREHHRLRSNCSMFHV